MPLTQQIIRQIVKDEVGSELKGTNQKIDQLEKSTSQRFDKLEKRLDPLEKRFDHLENRFDHLENRFDQLEESTNQRFDGLTQKIDKLTEVVIDFAGQMKKFDEEQTVLSGHVSNLTDRVEKLELAAV
jgi:chromosome segregation ATPase